MTVTVDRPLFRTRTYQRPIREARRAGCRRFLCLWHRRAGKDRNAATFCLECMLERVGVYFHVFPALNQGRRDFWDNIIQETIDGVEVSIKMVRACFPPELVRKYDDKEMQVELINGSLYQVMGCDDDEAVERLRGPNPIGLIYSEYAHGSKMEDARKTLMPVLIENGGWEIFAYTPKGENHGKALYDTALRDRFHPVNNPLGWFVQKLTRDDTYKDAQGESGDAVMPIDEIERLTVKEGWRPEFVRQEFWCDFAGFLHGTIYGDCMTVAETEQRIGDIPYVGALPVGVILDLGKSDAIALWFYQVLSKAIRFINYYSCTQQNLTHIVKILQGLPYIYGRIILPWDARGAEEYLGAMGFRNIYTCKRTESLQTSIDAVRREFPTFYFDIVRCNVSHNNLPSGIDSLKNYKRKWDEEKKAFTPQPIHDQFSHGADALRTGVEGGFEPLIFTNNWSQEVKVITDFDPRQMFSGLPNV